MALREVLAYAELLKEGASLILSYLTHNLPINTASKVLLRSLSCIVYIIKYVKIEIINDL